MNRTLSRNRILLLAAALGLAACTDSADIDLLEIEATGALVGLAFLDQNGNGDLDANDEPLDGVTVQLTAGVGGEVVQQADTDSEGVFEMTDVPVGTYSLTLDAAVLGDSLEAVTAGGDVTIRLDEQTQVNVGVSFPTLTIEEVRQAEPGRRVFTTGIALNPRQPFGDGLVHLKGDSLHLRATNVARATLNTGDSVRFLGRTARDAGQPILDDVTPTILISLAAIVVPEELTTAGAAAAGSELDAALARVRDADIVDTFTVSGDFHFTVDDGSGPLEAVIRSFLQPTTTGFRPDSVVATELTGLLVPFADPQGPVRWRMYLRGPFDVRLEIKALPVALGPPAEPASAGVGAR